MPNFSYGYAAQVVELSVDVETGHIVVDRVVNATTSARRSTPRSSTARSKAQSCKATATRSSRTCAARRKDRQPALRSTSSLASATSPPVVSVVLELADPLGPWGARGMAEMPMIPYAAAVVAALHDATGVWFDTFPLTPDRVLTVAARRRRLTIECRSAPECRRTPCGALPHSDGTVPFGLRSNRLLVEGHQPSVDDDGPAVDPHRVDVVGGVRVDDVGDGSPPVTGTAWSRSRRITTRSARLPTSIDPISSPSPSARAPPIVAISSIAGAGSARGPCTGRWISAASRISVNASRRLLHAAPSAPRATLTPSPR